MRSRLARSRLAVLALSCALAAALPTVSTAAPANGIRISEDGHDLVRADGSPTMLLADTAWHLLYAPNDAEIGEYLRIRKAQGFNAVMFTLLLSDPLRPDSGHRLPVGRGPDNRLTPAVPNPAFLDAAADKVARIERQGMVAMVMPTWGKAVRSGVFDATTAEIWGEAVARRLGGHDVIWILGGDTNPQGAEPEVWRAMARGLRRGEPTRRPIAFHPNLGTSSTWFADDPEFDFRSLQSGHARIRPKERTVPRVIRLERASRPAKPVIDLESGYEDIPDGLGGRFPNPLPVDAKDRFVAYDMRVRAYEHIVSGAVGYVYGCLEVAIFRDRATTPRWPPNRPWQEAIRLPGADQMRHVAALMNRIGRRSLTPADDLVVSGPGRNDYDTTLAGCSADHRLCAVYSSSGTAFTVRAPADARYEWFDPRTGAVSAARPSQPGGAGSQTFQPPASDERLPEGRGPNFGTGNDWILLITRG